MNLILLNGLAQSGKDTIGAYLRNRWGYRRESFAWPLKVSVSTIFGFPVEWCEDPVMKKTPLPAPWSAWTPRKLLQFVGTEMFRKMIDEDIWVKSCVERIKLLSPGDVVITDARFPNELAVTPTLLPNFRTISIRVNRDNSGAVGGIAGHSSEQQLPTDFCVDNNADFGALYAQIDAILMKEA